MFAVLPLCTCGNGGANGCIQTMCTTSRPRMRFVAAAAALLSLLLHAMLVVHVAGMKLQAAPSDPEVVAWLALTGAPICHGVQPEDDGKPDHAPKQTPCLICSGFQGTAALAQSDFAGIFDPVETALTYSGEHRPAVMCTRPAAFNARGPPRLLA